MTGVAMPEAGASPRSVRARVRHTLAMATSSRRDLRDACAALASQQVLAAGEVTVAAYAVSRAVRGATYDQLSPWILLLVLAALPQVRLPWAGASGLTAVANRVRVDQSDRLFRAVDGLDPAVTADQRTGQLTAFAADDISQVVRFFAHDLGSMVSTTTMMVVAVLGVTALDWRLGGVVALALGGLLALAGGAGPTRSPGTGARADEAARLTRSEIIDDLQGLREVVAAGAGGRIAVDLRARMTEPGHHGHRERRSPARALVGSGTALLPGLVLAAAAVLVAHHSLSPTLVAPAVALGVLAAHAWGRWLATLPELGRAFDSTERIGAVERASRAVPDAGC